MDNDKINPKIRQQNAHTPIDKKTEKEDLLLGLKRGNQKGATSRLLILNKLVWKDITHGFALVITIDSAKEIRKHMMCTLKHSRVMDHQWKGQQDEEQDNIKQPILPVMAIFLKTWCSIWRQRLSYHRFMTTRHTLIQNNNQWVSKFSQAFYASEL